MTSSKRTTGEESVDDPLSPGDATLNESGPVEGSWDASLGQRVRTAGDRIGQYIILEKIGAGGMGVVYAAYDPKLDRKVALKVLPGGAAYGGKEARERLVAEARALARVSHPNVVAVHDVGAHGDEVFVAMELVDGSPLHAWLKQATRHWSEIVNIFVEVGRGIVAIHEAGLIHRDIKPENVLIDHRGRAKVTDFGLARPRNDAPTVLDLAEAQVVNAHAAKQPIDLTRSGTTMGTPAYMAPEQFDGAGASESSDQFSFGVACWGALFGLRPFEGTSFITLMDNVVEGRLRDVPADTRVPTWVKRIIERSLAKDPKDRWPTMHALVEALEAGDPNLRRRRRWTGIAASVGLFAIGAGAFVSRRAQIHQEAERCEQAAASLAWDETDAAALEQHFVTSDAPNAARAAQDAAHELEEFVGAWRLARRSVCLPDEPRARLDAELATRADECLGDLRAQFDETVEVLTTGDAVMVSRALRTVQGLGQPEDCVDAEHLRRLPARPTDPDTRAAARGISRALMATIVDEHVGTWEEGLATSRSQLARAREIGYAPLVAQATYRVAVFLEKLGKYDEAVELWVDAFEIAAEAGDDELASDAARVLAFTEGYQLARYDVGLRWAQLAGVYHRRAGDEDGLKEAQRLDVMAIMLEMRGDLEGALAMHEKSLALRRSVAGEGHQSVGYGLHNMAAVLQSMGERERALDVRREALEIFTAHFGADNPTTLQVRFALANLERDLGQYDEADRAFEAILTGWSKSLGPDHPDVGDLHDARGRLRRAQGRLDEAVVMHRDALRIHAAALDAGHPDVGQTKLHLADALTAAARLEGADPALADEAEMLYRSALEIFSGAEGDQGLRIGNAQVGLGELALDRGDKAEAIIQLSAARTVYESSKPPPADALARVDAALERARALPSG